MKARHRKSGGKVPSLVSGNKDVIKEAKAKGGKFATGGTVGKTVGLMTGGAAPSRSDKPARRLGGQIGRPGPRPGRASGGGMLSSAHAVVSASKDAD